MKVAEYFRMLDEAKAAKKAKPRKYRNTKVEFGGLKFDSRREAARYGELDVLEKMGRIADLRLQVIFELAPAVQLASHKRKKPAMRYIADFAYVDENGQRVVEDVKSPITAKTAAFRAKLHLMKSVHGIDVKVSY
jgi:hypothetical protein